MPVGRVLVITSHFTGAGGQGSDWYDYILQ